MDVGLALPHFDHAVPGERPVRWATVVAWAQAAETAGLASAWVADHLFLSTERWGGPAEQHEGFDPLIALAGLARATKRVRLGTLVLCPHLRPAGVLAKALATVDVLSAGRLTVGVGAGWFEPEYRAAGLRFPPPGQRLALLEETLAVLRLAFAGEPFDYHGGHLDMEAMVCRPTPVQRPSPPLWVGGRGDRLLGVVARQADGWNALGWAGTLAEWRERSAALDRACEAAGRDPAAVARSVNRLALVGEDEADLRRRFEDMAATAPPGVLAGATLDEFRRGRLVGTVDEVAAGMASWAAEGVGTLIVTLGPLPFSVTRFDALEMVAAAVRVHEE
ncbi:MAG TPA: TIGR03619 family F420-dependent LLM class oxidoreductase [Acidimicrobiales bacterium]|nr:TIGR03619 family F420-dependent LLM class oxidoreductase [Acidimicrobiales bacterium]